MILSGPYRKVRHPIYSGEIGMSAGTVLMFPTAIGVLALGALVVFQRVRASMEETALSDASEEYARRFATTGMFLPRWESADLSGGIDPGGDSGETRVREGAVAGAQRIVLSLVAVLVIYGNVAAILRGYEGVPDRTTQPIRFHLYDAFMIYHLFTGYTTMNSEAQVLGHREDTGWGRIESDELLPFRPGYVWLRLRAWRHEHLFGGKRGGRTAQALLAAKVRERYNRLHPAEPIDAVAFGAWRWPSSSEGFNALRTPETERFEPWFSEAW